MRINYVFQGFRANAGQGDRSVIAWGSTITMGTIYSLFQSNGIVQYSKEKGE